MGFSTVPIPTRATWLAQTELCVRPRNSALKKLDAATKACETAKTPGKIKDVRVAFANWKRHNGDNWKAGPRNKGPNFPFTNRIKRGDGAIVKSKDAKVRFFGWAQVVLVSFHLANLKLARRSPISRCTPSPQPDSSSESMRSESHGLQR